MVSILHQNYFLLAMHTDNYINAVAIMSKAAGHPKFRKLTTEDRERWKIHETYVNYVIEVFGEENPILRRQNRRLFKVQKFLNG